MKARKKPIEIDYFPFTDDYLEQILRMDEAGGKITYLQSIDGVKELKIETLEGLMTATYGDIIINGVNGELYPCKPDIFYKTYDVQEISEGS